MSQAATPPENKQPEPLAAPKILPEYDELDATAIAELIHTGSLSPEEVLEAAIERAEIRNPQLNAIVTPLFLSLIHI